MQSVIPQPDYDDPKELYAYFGLTFYAAQVLEQGVVNLAVALSVSDAQSITQEIIRRLYDDFDTKTFGTVLRIARNRRLIPVTLDDDLSIALTKRNHLAHHFFIENDRNILTKDGRRKCIGLLIDDLRFFKRVDSEFQPIWQDAWSRLGVTQELVDRTLQEMANSANF